VSRNGRSLPSITVFDPDHVVEMIGRNLEEPTISESYHSVESSGRYVKNGFRPDAVGF
jgi:hypothetical protein